MLLIFYANKLLISLSFWLTTNFLLQLFLYFDFSSGNDTIVEECI